MVFVAFLVLAPKRESILAYDNFVVGVWAGRRWRAVDAGLARRHRGSVTFRPFGLGTTDRPPVRRGLAQDPPDRVTYVTGTTPEDAEHEAMLFGAMPHVPRPVRRLPLTAPSLALARAYASRRGLDSSRLRLVQAVQTDLDGDGSPETILSASAGVPGAAGWPQGAYSFVLLRARRGGHVVETPLAFASVPAGGAMEEKAVRAIADLDGDGRMEVLTTGWTGVRDFDRAVLWAYRAGTVRKLVEGAAAG